MAFVQTAVLPRSGLSSSITSVSPRQAPSAPPVGRHLTIEAAKHAQLKGAKKKNRRRPKKHRPSDIHRAPTPYNTQPLLADEIPSPWSLVDSASSATATLEPPQVEDETDSKTTTTAPDANE